MLTPKILKYKKSHKTKIKTKKNQKPIFNSYAIKSKSIGFLDSKVIETVRRLIVKKVGKKSKIMFRTSLDTPVTKKSISSRMGKGKGNHSNFIKKIMPGSIILEFIPFFKSCIKIKSLLKELQLKLPFSIKILNKNE